MPSGSRGKRSRLSVWRWTCGLTSKGAWLAPLIKKCAILAVLQALDQSCLYLDFVIAEGARKAGRPETKKATRLSGLFLKVVAGAGFEPTTFGL
ncbi:hypothetical protein PSEUDO8Z_100408 [Pseudomonas sp. 8Z]|nr:hypothetical protein PSEUDO8Z_100408 [Pseudomonas sp. 8Z]